MAPASTPTTPQMTASRIDSARNCVRIWLLVAPRARRRPISDRRSRTEMTMMLATPTAPTINATTPRPRKRLSNAPAAAARAVGTSDGWANEVVLGGAALRRSGHDPDVAEIPLGGRVADQGAGVDVGGQRRGFEDA